MTGVRTVAEIETSMGLKALAHQLNSSQLAQTLSKHDLINDCFSAKRQNYYKIFQTRELFAAVNE